jgi:type II secretory pathway component PulF
MALGARDCAPGAATRMTSIVILALALAALVAMSPARWRAQRLLAPSVTRGLTRAGVAHTKVTQAAIAEFADVLALCLAVGVEVSEALSLLAQAAAPELRPPLTRTVALLDVGANMTDAWAHWGAVAQPLVRAFERSSRTGAPVADECRRVAAELRQEQLASVQQQARGVGVRAVLPLMVCFLPAFVLVGVIPVVASLLTGLIAST